MYLWDFKEVDTIVQRLKDRSFCQDLRIAQLAHKAKLGILQEVNNELLESMRNKIENEKILGKVFIIKTFEC